ncbi:MAG: iron transporter [Conexibacteraceae bacterium]|nr:iron transporter [Conexibacteraceae bacterium]
MSSHRAGRSAAAALAVALAATAVAGCASADKHQTSTTAKNAAATQNASNSSAMSGMNMGGSAVASQVPSVNGIKPVASQVLATADWQGMKIQARTMTPTSFVIFDGTGHETLDKATKHDSFHLMIMLNDAHTDEPIAYATVWATIINGAGKTVFSERQWPMNSAYMGPHYGNNVPHIAPGRYTLKLLVSPPVDGRHLEYAHVWLKQHEVIEHFTWKPAT